MKVGGCSENTESDALPCLIDLSSYFCNPNLKFPVLNMSTAEPVKVFHVLNVENDDMVGTEPDEPKDALCTN